MTILSPTEGFLLLAIFGLTMFSVVWLKRHKGDEQKDSFLVAERQVPAWQGALSIAVSWIWAPAIFIVSMQAFNNGLPGVFWFTAPNIICFFTLTPVAIRLRKLLPQGYTLPEFIFQRFNGRKRTHLAFLTIFFGYQLGAIVINCLAGGALLHAVSGMNLQVAIIAMSTIALSYSLLSGLRASILTDVIQMIMVLGIGLILTPWCIYQAGGWNMVSVGLGGVTGEHRSLFDPWLAFAMGIPMTLGLIAGPMSDQMFFQRAMAVQPKDIAKTFIGGGLVFGIVPITLSLLGFLGAALAMQQLLQVPDPQIVGPVVVGHLLPREALYLYTLMAFAGLCSTLDSSLCAICSLSTEDVYRRYVNPKATNEETLRVARYSMFGLTVFGTIIALLNPKLLWAFLIYGALASAGLFPTVFSVFSKTFPERGAFWGIVVSLVFGLPLSFYANIVENPYLIVLAAVLSVVSGLVVALYFWRMEKGLAAK